MEVVPFIRRPFLTLEKLQMKKTLVALATLASVSAFAQNVTITGGVNYGVTRAAAGTQSFGSLKGDRTYLSFDVSEDLGGGSTIISRAQMRFNSSNGATWGSNTANSTELGKGATLMEQVMVGWANSNTGTLKFGRFTNDLGTHDFSTFEDSPIGTNASQAMYGRLSGQIQYTSPTVAGFTVSALQADAQANTWIASPGGGLLTGINYSTYSNTGHTNFGAAIVKYENGPLLLQGASIGGLVGEKATRLSARYTLGSGAKIYYGSYKQSGTVGVLLSTMPTTATYTMPVKYSSTAGLQEHTSTELGFAVPVGQVTLRGGYVTNNNDLEIGKSDGTTKASKVALGLDYNLSKRSMIIIQGAKVSNSSYNLSAGGSALYDVSSSTATGGSQYFVGLQSSF